VLRPRLYRYPRVFLRGFSLRNFGASILALASVAYGLIHIILPPVRNADLPRTSTIFVFVPILNLLYGLLVLFKRSAIDSRNAVLTAVGPGEAK
jgi:hypothetical protein